MPTQLEFTPEELTILEKTPLSAAYTETFVFTPASAEEENLGSLFIVAEIVSNKTKKENAALAAELAGALKNEYYKNTIVTPLSALKFSLKKANYALNQKKPWLNPQIGLKIKIIVAALKAGTLHLARLGEASALILRNNRLETITPFSPITPLSPLSFDNIISGELMAEDRIVLATNQIHKISEEDLIYQLKQRELVKYLRRSSEGIKNLALVALYPKRSLREEKGHPTPITPLIPPWQKGEAVGKKEGNGKKWVKPVILVLVLLAIFTALGVAAVKIKRETAQNKIEAEALVQEATAAKEKILALLAVKNETEASELLISTEEKLKRLEELKLFKTTRATLAEDLKKIAAGLEHTENINSVRKIIDLENNSAGFDPQDLALGRNKILTFSGRVLYRFDLNRKSGGFESLEEGAVITAVLEKPDDPNTIYLATQDKIIAHSNSPESKTIWARPEDMPALKKIAFYGEAFYLLDENGLIYKLSYKSSTATPDITIGEPQIWTNQSPTTNYQLLTTNLAVSDSIFGLTPNNTLVEMQNGEKKKGAKLREEISKIYTSANHKNIYALAPSEGIILVLDKELSLKKRLGHPELVGAKSFVVNSQERMIYFLKGKTVYSFEI